MLIMVVLPAPLCPSKQSNCPLEETEETFERVRVISTVADGVYNYFHFIFESLPVDGQMNSIDGGEGRAKFFSQRQQLNGDVARGGVGLFSHTSFFLQDVEVGGWN